MTIHTWMPPESDEEEGQRPLTPYHDSPSSDPDNLIPTAHDQDRAALQIGLDNPSTPARESWRDAAKDRIPPRLRFWSSAVVNWVKGPRPPRIYRLTTLFPHIQHAPLDLLDAYAPKRLHRFGLLIAFYTFWLLAFILLLWRTSFTSEVAGYGNPLKLSCSASFWSVDNDNGCGFNGDACRPFSNASMAFRCPARCLSEPTWHKKAVGVDEIFYKPFVVGGPTNLSDPIGSAIYRADSYICQAAIHAGFVTDSEGGCGALDLIGERSDFPATTAHGLSSTSFDSYFEKAFAFNKTTQTQCKDQRAPVVVVSIFATVILSLFTTSPAVFFWSIFVGLFFTTALFTDPPNLATYNSLISLAVSRFLPACFCMAVMYKYAVRYTLSGLTAQIEKSLLWLIPLWLGTLNNYTFDRIPIRRLTPHDLQSQPGAILALVIIVLCIFSIALAQAWCFRVEGRMPRYLLLYGIMSGSLLLLLVVPGMHIRIHHYVLALLFLPGTALQTRLSLACQGLLVGLFLNGIARWGFDGLLELPENLFQGDSLGTLLPLVAAPVVGFAAGGAVRNITFELGPLPAADEEREYDGYTVLVNDVERLRAYRDGGHYGDVYEWDDKGRLTWTWTRYHDGLPEYFRFAYMSGSQTDDYTKAGTVLANGTWVPMEKGPSN